MKTKIALLGRFVRVNEYGERDLTLMRWGFKLPDRFLFNVRSEEVTTSKFWKEKFAENRCIIPVSSYFEGSDKTEKPKPKYEISMSGREYLGIAGLGLRVRIAYSRNRIAFASLVRLYRGRQLVNPIMLTWSAGSPRFGSMGVANEDGVRPTRKS